MALALKDASDFSGRNVPQILGNQVSNTDRLAGVNDFSLANHANAFNRKATGVEVWYYANDLTAKPVAEKLSKAIADALGLPNRGAKPTTNLYVISNSLSHMLLVEWFFIDNPHDVKQWHKNKHKAIAAAIKVMQSYPQYRFRATHGGHFGLNMMDPGAVGNNLKEAVVMQEVNKALINYKTGTQPKPPKEPEKITQGVSKAKMGLWYRSHLSNVGWLGYVGSESTSGTTGKNIGLEAIDARWDNQTDKISASFEDIKGKWHEWSFGNTGSTGKGLALAKVRFDLAIDVRNSGRTLQYRVHSQDVGWSKWVSQGTTVGKKGKQIEAIQMRIVKNGVVERG